MTFDAIIIGGGAGGLSTALWCDELGLSSLLLEETGEFGGQLLRIYNEIKNHAGVETENGRGMRDIFLKQIENRRFTKRLKAKVSAVDFEKKTVILENSESFTAKTIVIATGVRRRKLNVEGEETFKNRGILESGKRDKDSVEGKNVLIVGGGDAAFENALILSENASRVTLAHRGENFRARAEFIEQAANNPKVKILTETIVREIAGREKVETVRLENVQTKEEFNISVEAVLVRVGVEPNTDFLRGRLDLDENNYIKIDSFGETSEKGIFAVGDAANPIAPTISSAVGMGATVAKTIFARLNAC